MVNHMDNIKTFGDILEYEYLNDDDKLYNYNVKILEIYKLIFKCIPESMKNKIIFDKSKPTSTTINAAFVKQQRMENLRKNKGITFKLFGNDFNTDLGEGLCGWHVYGYTYTEANDFNKNITNSNFATRKEKKTFNTNNNSYFTEYFWHVNDCIIEPLDGFYKGKQIRDSWNKVCNNYNIFDNLSFKKYLEK